MKSKCLAGSYKNCHFKVFVFTLLSSLIKIFILTSDLILEHVFFFPISSEQIWQESKCDTAEMKFGDLI